MKRLQLYEGVEVFIESRLVVIGKDGGGFERHANALYLQVEEPNGRRWNHHTKFDTQVITILGIEDVTNSAKRKIEKLRYRVLHRGWIDMDHWDEGFPKYGSKRYQIVNGV